MNNNITNRYTIESQTNCNLSCGNNLEIANIKSGEKVLDLGCGKGNETILAAKLSYPAVSIGLDLTQKMIDIAISNSQNIDNVKFIVGDIENLPFEENTFDVVISNCVINHAQDKSLVFKQIYKVLKKGGRFVISDAVTKHSLPDKIKKDPEMIAQCFGGAITESEYIASIKSANFSNIDIVKKREYIKNGYDFASITIFAVK